MKAGSGRRTGDEGNMIRVAVPSNQVSCRGLMNYPGYAVQEMRPDHLSWIESQVPVLLRIESYRPAGAGVVNGAAARIIFKDCSIQDGPRQIRAIETGTC
jgi:hypothetical protein